MSEDFQKANHILKGWDDGTIWQAFPFKRKPRPKRNEKGKYKKNPKTQMCSYYFIH
jgi:hypothetical protein